MALPESGGLQPLSPPGSYAYAYNVLHANTYRLTESDIHMTSHFQDGGYDVISRSKVLPPGEWTHIQRLPGAVLDL